MSQGTCPVVGLVGGVGSGKSTLARRMVDRSGAAVVDGDAAGHRAIADPAVKIELRKTFGDNIFATDGSVDRKMLASRVFGDSEDHRSAKVNLERITHPFIEQELREQISEALQSNAALILLDAAVLLEAGWNAFCDAVIFVDASDELRRVRAMSRGWSEEEWRKREAAQMSLLDKRGISDAVVENTGRLDEAVEKLTTTIERLCQITLPRSAAAVGTS